MFSQEDIVLLKNYCQSVIYTPRGFDKQLFVREGSYIWCDDWRIIEILKYFFNGREMYLADPPPNRLKNNPLWSKNLIMSQAEEILTIYHTPEEIINHLRQEREKVYA